MAFLVRDYVVVWVVLVVASILGAGRLGVRGEGGRGGGETNFKLSRSSFPKGFVFGIASSAYQFEGAAKEGGKGLSIWDVYAHKHPEKIKDGSNADITVDEYHRYKEDVSIMKDIGFDAYRLSISWTRILPKGNLRGGLNQEGIQYYNDLINELLSKGIQPYVTIFHWDSPQGLEDEYLGFLSSKIVKDFRDYADICFKKFGDRVKHWITFNEPHSFCVGGYAKVQRHRGGAPLGRRVIAVSETPLLSPMWLLTTC